MKNQIIKHTQITSKTILKNHLILLPSTLIKADRTRAKNGQLDQVVYTTKKGGVISIIHCN